MEIKISIELLCLYLVQQFYAKLCSEIVWHRFFAVPAFIGHFRSYIPVKSY